MPASPQSDHPAPPSGHIQTVIACLALVLLGGLPHSNQLSDVDAFWHLAAGEEAMSRGALWLTEDVFTYTVPQGHKETPPFYWGFQMLLALASKAGGLAAIQVLVVAIATAVGGLLYGILRRFAGASPAVAAAVAVTVVSVIAASRMVPRPQLVQMVCFLAVFWLLEEWRREALAGKVARRVFLAAPVFLVWANCHGPSLIMGCLLFLCYLADAAWRWRRARGLRGDAAGAGEARALGILGGAFGASVLASLLSPSFVKSYTVILGYADLTLVGETVNIEYQPLWAIANGRAPMAYLALALVALAALRTSRINLAWWLATLGFTALCLRAHRLVDLAAFAAALPLAAGIARVTKDRMVVEWALLAVVAGLVVGTTGLERRDRYGWGADGHDLPVQAVEWVQARADLKPSNDRLFCDQYFGGYVSWSTRGRYRISWDGRTWLYYDMLALPRKAALRRFPGHVLILRSYPLLLPTGPEEPLQPNPARYALMYVDRAARVYLARPHLEQPIEGEISNVRVTEAGFEPNPAALPAALTEFERMAATNSDNPAYFFGLGLTHMNLDQLPEAEAAFGRALELEPGAPGSMTNLAAALLMQDRFADALETLAGGEHSKHFAGGRNQQHLRVLYLNRAAAHKRLGQKQAVRRTLKECLDHFPNDAAARQMLKDLEGG